ncbi:MAG: TPM domain-containing protein [Burkholderiaceae bacterium]|jgi:hypothetical protein|nr:TPM domain-containing protein [Burkholderiaceae bacterium]
MFSHLMHVLHHHWIGPSVARRAVPSALAERLARQVAASEACHGGEIRLCVEGGLPASYLWRHLFQRVSMETLARQRAAMMFAKLRVWDTEANNGVLIYVLLAGHHLEIVADRGITRHVPPAEWQVMIDRLSQAFARGQVEQGLTQAVADVGAALERHFPLPPGTVKSNELPNEPVIV